MLQEFEGYNSLEYQPRGRNSFAIRGLGGGYPLYQTDVPAVHCLADIHFCRIVK